MKIAQDINMNTLLSLFIVLYVAGGVEGVISLYSGWNQHIVSPTDKANGAKTYIHFHNDFKHMSP